METERHIENTPYGSDAFVIPFEKLKDGVYDYNFELDTPFFAEAGVASEIQSAGVNVQVNISKAGKEMLAKFKFEGQLGLISDRSLQPFDFPLSFQHQIIFTEDTKKRRSDADEVVYLQAGETKLDLRQDLFDLVTLQVPFRKVAPDESDALPPEMARYLVNSLNAAANDAAEKGEENIDPRWSALKDLKNKFED